MTGQASKVSKGLRSIGANITKLASSGKPLTYTIDGATKSIDLFDKSTGDMKNTYQVLSEIATGWDSMTNAEQSALALSLAGRHGSCSYRFNCWKFLKILILNYNSNIIYGKFKKFEIVIT